MQSYRILVGEALGGRAAPSPTPPRGVCYGPAALVMNSTSEMVRVKEAFAWVEAPRCVQLKAVAAGGAPVELDAAQTRKLAERLLKLAQTLENLQADAEEDG